MRKLLFMLMLFIPMTFNMNCETLIDTDDKVVRCEDDTKVCYVFKINGQSIVRCSKKLTENSSK